MNAPRCPLCRTAAGRLEVVLPTAKIYRCSECNNGWTLPPPPPTDYAEGDFHKETLGSDVAPTRLESLPVAWRKAVLAQCDLIKRNVKPGASILEIGCGDGVLLQELTDAGFRTTGIEPSASASRRARMRGLDVREGYFPHPEVNGKFDAVIMGHVLEHLPDPEAILQQIEKHLDHGFLLLIQANLSGFVPRVIKQRWYAWMPSQHFWHFTPRGLTFLAAKSGYAVVKCEYSSLVPMGRLWKLIEPVTNLWSSCKDQFHLLLRSARPRA